MGRRGSRSRSRSPVRLNRPPVQLQQRLQQQQQVPPVPHSEMSRRSKSHRSATGRVVNDDDTDPDWVNDLMQDIEGSDLVMDSDNGRVTIALPAFLRLLRRRNTRHKRPPQNFVVSAYACITVEGASRREQESAEFSFVFDVYVLSDEWTEVMLVSQDLAATTMDVVPPPRPASSSPSPTSSKSPASSPTPGKKPGSSGGSADDPLQDGYVAVRHGYYKLFAGRSGRYRVQLTALVPHKTAQRRGVILELPFSSKNRVTYTVDQEDVLINASPSLQATTKSTDGTTTMVATFPPTNQLNLNWTEKVPEQEEEAAPAEPIHIAVEQHNMISVGESVVVTTAQLVFQISNGTRNLFEVAVNHPHCRVLHVTGKHIKRWEVVDPVNAASAPPAEGANPEQSVVPSPRSAKRRVLRVFTEFGIEGQYSLNLVAEHQMSSTSGQVSIPTFDAANVDREKGYLTLEARTNVEVREVKSGGLGSVDVAELPSTVTRRVINPILLAYKFVSSDYFLDVEVRKHADISVLTATVDECWVTGTIADTHLVVRYVLKIRNTTTQYVRFNIPRDAEVWSTMVGGEAVKPASDDEGKIMVPLVKNSKETFLVDVVYQTEHPVMKSRGKGVLNVFLPSIDIPINNMYVSLWVPEDYQYADFTGDMKEIRAFPAQHPDISSPRAMKKQPGPMVPRAAKQQVMMQSNVANFSLDDDLFLDIEEQLQVQTTDALNMYKSKSSMNKSKGKRRSAGPSGGGYGMLPVEVTVPKVGKEFRFQSLFVMEKDLTLRAEYRKKSKGYFSRRRVSMLDSVDVATVATAVAVPILASFIVVYRENLV